MNHLPLAISHVLILLSMLSIAVGCKTGDKPPKAYFEIWDTARIGDKMYLVNSEDEQFWGEYYRYADSGIVDSAGHISFSFQTDSNAFWKVVRLAMPEQHNFNYFDYLVVNPGDTLVHYRNGEDSIWAEGSLAYQIEYYRDFYNSLFSDELRSRRSQSYSWEADSFKTYLNWRLDTLNGFLYSYLRAHPVNSVFKDYQATRNNLRIGYQYTRYLQMHTYYAGKDYKYILADSIGFDFEPYLQTREYPWETSYRDILNASVTDALEAVRLQLPDSTKYDYTLLKRFNIIKSNFDHIQRDIVLAYHGGDLWQYLWLDTFFEEADSILKYFESNHASPVYLDYYKKELAKYKRIEPGAPAPDFTLPDTSGNLVSLSDFHGKVVYINFWGTWCGPCIQSIPDHKALHDTFSDTDEVVFLNVSMEYDEEDAERWKNFIREKDYFGDNVVNLVGQKQTRDPRYEPYGIRAAPTYVLIDQEGRIAKPRADYPTEVIKEIKALLNKKTAQL